MNAFRFSIPNQDYYGNTNITGCLGISRYSTDDVDENYMFMKDLKTHSLITTYMMGIFIKKNNQNKIANGSHITIGANDTGFSYPAY
jgi:hypothetical protein